MSTTPENRDKDRYFQPNPWTGKGPNDFDVLRLWLGHFATKTVPVDRPLIAAVYVSADTGLPVREVQIRVIRAMLDL